jgi:prepilin-type N-terminal cleavage/methylation domain-containing protein
MRSRQARGFTLVELMVALVAGVIIAIAVIGLAKSATQTFYEEARLTNVEQSVRAAANRLRYDLTKVSFMGTGNIQLASFEPTDSDPPNFFVPYGHKVASNKFAGVGLAGSRYTNKSENLQGIHIIPLGSTTVSGEPEVATYAGGPNFTAPDLIEIGGNMTTDDWYTASWEAPPSGAAGSCGGGILHMRAQADPATERLIGDNLQNVVNAFTPGPANTRHFARVIDQNGCHQFVEVKNATAINVGGVTAEALVDVCTAQGDNGSLLPQIEDTVNKPGVVARKGCGATPVAETLRVSPYQRVRWRVGKNKIAQIEPLASIAPANTTFVLYREMLDSSGTVIDTLTQTVAEFAVDLKFGIAVDARESSAPPNNISVFDLDSDTGTGNIYTWTNKASATTLTQGAQTQPGPQRVRSVKFRISTRAAMPDRTQPLTLIPNSPYISRYCVDMPGCTKFARVRTVTSEVPLINQARMTY